MVENVVSVLTFKSVETILKVGGTQSWALNQRRAKGCKYVVVCRNANDDPQGPEAHASAFMVGKIEDIVPSTETEGRWLIKFNEYALCDAADQWEGRNPVAYWTNDDYEKRAIDFDALVFGPMPEPAAIVVPAPRPAGLTIVEAKAGLSITFGVPASAIEITVRA